MKKVGDEAPDFALPAVGGRDVRLADHRPALLAFTPAAFVPRAARDLLNFETRAAEVRDAGGHLLAVTSDSVWAAQVFAASLGGLSYPLLGDLAHRVARDYDVARDDGMCDRALYVVDRAGRIRYARRLDAAELPPLDEAIAALRG